MSTKQAVIYEPLAAHVPGAFRARCNLTTTRPEKSLTAEELAEAKANGYPRTFLKLESGRVDKEYGLRGRWEYGFPACAGFETDNRAAYEQHMIEAHNRPVSSAQGYSEPFMRSIRAGWRKPSLAPSGKPVPKATAELLRTCANCGLAAEVEGNAGELWWAEHERGCSLIAAAEVATPDPEPESEPVMQSGAWLSDDGRYRYSLWRRWADGGTFLAFVMLNPSIANGDRDDPTIRLCIKIARLLGYSGLLVVNLYALVSTDPDGLWAAEDPVGPANDEVLRAVLAANATAGLPVVAAWGSNARDDRIAWLRSQPGAEALHCRGITAAGQPKHPLARGRARVDDDAPLVPWPVVSR